MPLVNGIDHFSGAVESFVRDHQNKRDLSNLASQSLPDIFIEHPDDTGMFDFVASQFEDRLPGRDVGDATHRIIATFLFQGSRLFLGFFKVSPALDEGAHLLAHIIGFTDYLGVFFAPDHFEQRALDQRGARNGRFTFFMELREYSNEPF